MSCVGSPMGGGHHNSGSKASSAQGCRVRKPCVTSRMVCKHSLGSVHFPERVFPFLRLFLCVWQPWSQHPSCVPLEASILSGCFHQQRPQDQVLSHSTLYLCFPINIWRQQIQKPTSACFQEGLLNLLVGIG